MYRRAAYGAQMEEAEIAPADVDARKSQGWVESLADLPNFDHPDTEVMDLIVSDLRSDLNSLESEYGLKIQAVKRKIGEKAAELAEAHKMRPYEEHARERVKYLLDVQDVQERVEDYLDKKGTTPTPVSELAKLAKNDIQKDWIGGKFARSARHQVGQEANGMILVVGDVEAYNASQINQKAKERLEKEAAIRARMTAQN